MIYVFSIACLLEGMLVVYWIDNPKNFFSKWLAPQIVGFAIGFLGQTLHDAEVSLGTLFLTGVLCVIVGVALYYIGMFLTLLFLHRFFRG